MIRCAAVAAVVLAAGCGRCDRAEPPAKPEPVREAKRVRKPAVAGSFYPADPAEVRATVRKLLEGVPRTVDARTVLVPHAGWSYSGAIAATAIRQLRPGFDRVVLVASNHDGKLSFSGASVDRSTHWEVPGLEVRVSRAAEELLGRPGFVDLPAAHAMHMLEVELPFLAEVAGGPFEIVPLIIGRLSREETRSLAAELARLDSPKTAFVFSVDLSHYHPYEEAVALDRPCLEALRRADADDVARCDTDGTQVLLVLGELAARQSRTPRFLAYANSGDVTGDRSRVVGYGAMAWEDRLDLEAGEQAALLDLARRAVETRVRDGAELDAPPRLIARLPRLGATRGAFVTLKIAGRLRGCIGTLEAKDPLARDVARNAVHVAVHDARFPPVRADELGAIRVSISVLEPPRPWTGPRGDALAAELGRSRPGFVIEYRGRRSTFLPEVWEDLSEPAAFLDHLCQKQGSPESCWREPDARFESYGAQHFGEPGP